jgi:hypothetical protein
MAMAGAETTGMPRTSPGHPGVAAARVAAECRLTPSGFAWSALISFAKRFIPAMAAHSALGSPGV